MPSPSRSSGLKAGGAEVAWIETMSAPEEIRAAAEAAIRVGLPYTYTGSFDTAGRTMMGLAPKDIHGVAAGLAAQPLAVGANCGVGASDILASLLDMTAARPEATVIVKGNCGIPRIPRRGDPLFRHAGTDGRLCAAGRRCRRPDRRRLLRHLVRASRRDARGARRPWRVRRGRRSIRSSRGSVRCATSKRARAAAPTKADAARGAAPAA